ncbi:deoxynucleoside kinase [Enterococcus sp. ZJ1668]|uniref:deoxynucleoside kinase n=1 Tax=Enterococcus sp. ZJ1668 TaxID=2709402 RepID=UPI0013EA6AFF|nr:deoxynucleoside kinase [Enterococcus sp. ZJ1668]
MIIVAGTIGAGKSTLTEMLAQNLETKPFYENVEDNEVLPLFYSNPEKYTFLLQIFFLNKRFLAIKDAFSHDDNVLDRSIYEDSMLFHLNADLGRVSEVEVQQYEGLLETMLKELEEISPQKKPDLLVYIRVSFDTMLERIKKRGRDYEQLEQDPELFAYYKELNRRYEEWFEHFDVCPKMVIDGDTYDFVADPVCGEQIVREIRTRAEQMSEEADAGAIRYTTDRPKAKGIFSK